MPKKQPKPSEQLAGIVVLMVLIVAIMLGIRSCKSPDDDQGRPESKVPEPISQVLKNGDTAHLDMGGDRAWVAVDAKALEELNRYSRAKDEAGVESMVAEDRLLICDRRTKVTVLEAGLLTMTVQIQEGPHAGRRGIIASEFVKK